MSEDKLLAPLKCPKCKQELITITGIYPTATYTLEFHKKLGKYIRHSAVLDVEDFACSHCGFNLPSDFYERAIEKNLVAVKLDGLHKTVLLDFGDIPFDIDYAELCDKLPREVNVKKQDEKKKEKKT